MRLFLALASLLAIPLAFSVVVQAPSLAVGEGCVEDVDIIGAGLKCPETIEKARARIRENGTGPGATLKYRVILHCIGQVDAEICRMSPCASDVPRFLYALQSTPVNASPPQWSHVSYVCLTSPEELIQTISAADVAREFKRLTWPAARMTIQPPDGETLVNLPTIFFTNDTSTQTQTVTLLGQTVEIEATPAEWTWHWATPGDDGTPDDRQPFTTADPGSPHPDATVTHAYTRADATVRPRLDVTYTGQFRVNNGPWEDIPETHTVNGDPQNLRVLEARPTLVR